MALIVFLGHASSIRIHRAADGAFDLQIDPVPNASNTCPTALLATAAPQRCRARPAYKIASMPLRRITLSSTSAGPVGRFAPRSNCDT